MAKDRLAEGEYMKRYTIKELPVLERPYEKLETYGPKSLSNTELLAIILKSGTREETSIQLAQKVLNECCSVDGTFSLRNVSFETLVNIKGIGRVKAIILQAVFELANRINTQVREKPFLFTFKHVSDYLLKTFSDEKQEKFKVLGLDTKGRLEKDVTVLMGALNKIEGIEPREIFRMPLECGCKNIIVAHNHPSGDPTPSQEDIMITQNIHEWGRMLKIQLVDHIVVGDKTCVSIRQLNKFNWKVDFD